MKERRAEDCLIVAADFDPDKVGGEEGVLRKTMELAELLRGLGVYIKINTILRVSGYGLITQLHDMGLKVMADLKLFDIPETMGRDAALLAPYGPDILTVMAKSVDGMMRVKVRSAQSTEILGVTVLTSFDEEECQQVYSCSTRAGVVRFARMAQLAGIHGLVLSPKEIDVLKKRSEITLGANTPGIRPDFTIVENDDQARTATPGKAIKNGTRRVIIGRPIVNHPDPREAAQKTLEEIAAALAEMKAA